MIAAFLLLAAQASPAATADAALFRRIERVLERSPVIDGHNDLAWEIRELHEAKVESVDLSRDTAHLPYPLQTDIPRLRKGHVGGQFWSVYIPADAARAVEMTLEEIDIVRRFVAANPATFELATTAADIRRIEKAGRIASLIGVEGGHQIDGRLSVLRQYRALGVAYMTLTHGKSLNWADSSTDAPRANGLSAFGRQVIAEMNRIGMIVDVSHVSDATMAAALAATKAPVIASHSSARAIAEAPRNIPDDLLRAIGTNGGVVMVNFYPSFLSGEWRAWDVARSAYAKSIGVPAGVYGAKAPAPLVAWDAAHPEPPVTAATVADHVDHIAKVAGHDHIGIGGDFDGIQGTGPIAMKGVDGYPLLFAELARRGWSNADLARLSGGNVLRVMVRVEAVAKGMAGMPPVDATDVASL
ncbi:membrane dipeptidase [Sphingomonas sp. UV9]|uniref:dipeptidase n=1 Tax=Sphingomonas sp. UV9 TaxID=1851410 RepID=UPI000FFC5A38|nr:dipeptidase [Sphingomonas sp. UV9]RXD03212.1 membrane dipeptidase [Sphingomonas sp. UV9]